MNGVEKEQRQKMNGVEKAASKMSGVENERRQKKRAVLKKKRCLEAPFLFFLRSA